MHHLTLHQGPSSRLVASDVLTDFTSLATNQLLGLQWCISWIPKWEVYTRIYNNLTDRFYMRCVVWILPYFKTIPICSNKYSSTVSAHDGTTKPALTNRLIQWSRKCPNQDQLFEPRIIASSPCLFAPRIDSSKEDRKWKKIKSI